MAAIKRSTDRVRSGGAFCSALNCLNAKYKNAGKEKRFHTFPADEERCRRWVVFSRRQDLEGMAAKDLNRKGYLLCSDHFEDSQYNNPTERTRLTWNAVPTVFDVPNPPPKVTPARKRPAVRLPCEVSNKRRKVAEKPAFSEPEVTTDTQSTDDPTPSSTQSAGSPTTSSSVHLEEVTSLRRRVRFLEKQLEKEVKRKRSKTKKCKNKKAMKKRELFETLSRMLPPKCLSFVKTQLREVQREGRAHRWSIADKTTAMSIFHASAKAYRLLKKIFVLPSVSTLRRTIQKIQIYPGFQENIIQALKEKTEAMPTNADLCAIVLDEMCIKEEVVYNKEKDEVEGYECLGDGARSIHIANHATVFMARGLISHWKQPIGFFLSSGPMPGERLFDLVKQCIEKIEEAGLKVKVVISDQGSNNRKAFERLFGVSESNPFFVHNNHRIHFLYDPPHLLKSVRNNFFKSGLMVGDTHCRWEHIETFYYFDKQNPVRMAPKLTDKHIHLPAFSKMSVKLAAQVLSHTVAAGISTLVKFGSLPAEAQATALFVEKMDRLFNCFNSGNVCSSRAMGHAMTSSSGHEQFLRDTLQWLQSVRSPSSKSLPCLVGWRMAVRALLGIFDDLHHIHSVRFLLTDRLNQDCLENFFSCIRGKGGHITNPNAQQFRMFFRQLMVDSLFDHSRVSNCLADNDKFLLTLTSVSCIRAATAQPCDNGTETGTDDDEGRDRVVDSDHDDDGDRVVDRDHDDDGDRVVDRDHDDDGDRVVDRDHDDDGDRINDPAYDADGDRVLCDDNDMQMLLNLAIPDRIPQDKNLQTTQENVLVYISGYIAKKLMKKFCDRCQSSLRGSLAGSEAETFLANKQYAGAQLIVPSQLLCNTVKLLELAYCKNIDFILPRTKVKTRLYAVLHAALKDTNLSCSLGACDLKGNVVRLFTDIRLHFSLKDSSRSFSQKGRKRNQKMMKLHHV